MNQQSKEPSHGYQAPALEKGLDILEFLADRSTPHGMVEIANSLGRSRNEIYRMLVVLERRCYIERMSDDRYELTNKLFELGMRIAPRRNLHDAALPHMHLLADSLFQSCHLVVASGNEMVVVARVESPDLLGFAVRVGYRRPILNSTSGRLLYAFMPEHHREEWLKSLRITADSVDDVSRFLEDCGKVARKGVHIGPSPFVDAVTDIAAPIFDGGSEGIVATLVVPFVSGRSVRTPIDEAVEELKLAAQAIGRSLEHG